MTDSTLTLAIETSCDDTAIALVSGTHSPRSDRATPDLSFNVLSEQRTSQIALHAVTGGVVPEVAARAHLEAITPLLDAAFVEAKCTPLELDTISVTHGPGLLPSLLTGTMTARTLSYAWGTPLYSVHHLRGHLLATLLQDSASRDELLATPFPWLAVLVSGGHTLLLEVRSLHDLVQLGTTRDDAAGEAFDKGAKMMGLGYPGGPVISKYAASGNPEAFTLPRPMSEHESLDVSFSGLKTALRLLLEEQGFSIGEKVPENALPNLCASFQAAIIETLAIKMRRLLRSGRYNALCLGGGVAANPLLREECLSLANNASIPFIAAPNTYCMDNASMIGVAGLIDHWLLPNSAVPWKDLETYGRLPLVSSE